MWVLREKKTILIRVFLDSLISRDRFFCHKKNCPNRHLSESSQRLPTIRLGGTFGASWKMTAWVLTDGVEAKWGLSGGRLPSEGPSDSISLDRFGQPSGLQKKGVVSALGPFGPRPVDASAGDVTRPSGRPSRTVKFSFDLSNMALRRGP
jgi:hypothetical protein